MSDRFSNSDKQPEFIRSHERTTAQQFQQRPPVAPQQVSKSGAVSRRVNKKIPLLIVLVILVVAAVIILLNVFNVFNSGSKIEQSSAQFVSSATTSNADSIYAQFSDELKGMQTKDSLTANLATLSLDSTCKFTTNSVDEGAAGKKTVKGTIQCESKKFNAHFGYNADGELINYSIAPLNN